MKSDEEIGADAAVIARKRVLAEAKSVKLTTKLTLQRIYEGLNACENKATYDKDRGKWVYSKDLVAWDARAKATDQSIVVLDMKPCEKKKIDVNHSGSIMAAVAAHLSQEPPTTKKGKK
jgi:hypothetical protein